ncbi:MAG: hypothetical protein QUS12_03215, partial [Methanosarcina sp.]|nr:hypothetical protein [Methanosarcina sp.]
MCGKENAFSSERCNYCNAALKPFNISETPSTSENESDWLSSLRSDSGGNEESIPLPEDSFSGTNTPEEEAPDWLLRIRQRMEAENTHGRERKEDQAAQKPEESDAIPDWLRGLSDIPVEEGTPPQSEFISESESEDETPESTEDWLSRLQEPAQEEKPLAQEIPEIAAEDAEQEAPIPDETEAEEWLKNLAAWQAPVSYEKPEQPTPLASEHPEGTSEEHPSFEIFQQPEHIREFFKDEQNIPEQPEEHPVERSEEQPDWFKALQQQVGSVEEPAITPSEEPELPSWLRDFDRTIETSAVSGEALGEVSSEQDNSLKAEPAFLEEENPLPFSDEKHDEGISAFIPENITTPENREEKETPEIAFLEESSATNEIQNIKLPEEESLENVSGLPDWLSSVIPENEEQPSPVVPPFEENILPDWLNEVQEPPESEKAPFPQVFDVYQPVDRNPKVPVSPFEEPELPEWFSELPQHTETSSVSEVPVPSEEIAPAELPTWLKAMKPEEPRLPLSDATGFLQQSGPLAGLPEILPSVEQTLSIRKTSVQA